MLTQRPTTVCPLGQTELARWTRGVWLGLAAVLVPGAAGLAQRVVVERDVVVMGTGLRVLVEAPDRTTGLAASEAAFAAVLDVDELLSTWRGDSELARVNHAPPDTWVTVSDELFAVLDELRRWHDATDGAFDPGVGALITAWDLRGAGRRPAAAELAGARAASGIARFGFDRRARTVRRPAASSWLDAGAFGKGLALEEARHRLVERGVARALLNFGGQVLVIGAPAGEAGWRVSVAHPARRAEAAAVLRLVDRSAATTSQSQRGVVLDGERLGHVLDPRTGRPVPAWGSVTVVAADPMVADILATALFVLGPEAGRRWAARHPEIGALFLEASGDGVRASWSAGMEPFLVQESLVSARR